MKKIITILSAALCALFFACSPVINNSFTANGSNSFSGELPYKPHKNDVVQGFGIVVDDGNVVVGDFHQILRYGSAYLAAT